MGGWKRPISGTGQPVNLMPQSCSTQRGGKYVCQLHLTRRAQRAREVATLKRLGLYRNSMPLGVSSGVEVVSE